MTAETVRREVRVVRFSTRTIPFGGYATTDVQHQAVMDGSTGTLCLACFGWFDDPRHVQGGVR